METLSAAQRQERSQQLGNDYFVVDDENVFFHNGPIEKPVAESYRLTIYPSSDMIPRVRAERLP